MDYAAGETEEDRCKDDVRAAMEEGIDGFAVDAFSGKQAEYEIGKLIAAANLIKAENFKVFLSADMSLGFRAADIVKVVSILGNDAHYQQMMGRPLLSTYGGSELGPDWWEREVLKPLEDAGHKVTFVPYFDRADANGDDPSYQVWSKTIKAFPAVDGLMNFGITASTPFYTGDENIGHHRWSALEGEENLAKALRATNKIFIAPVLPYFWAVCHSARQYIEYQGGRGIENTWASIINQQKPQMVEIITWNDYSESSYIQPTRMPLTKTPGIQSFPHLAYYELLKYYIAWYKSGIRPALTKDALFYFYRPVQRPPAAQSDADCPMGPVPEGQRWGKLKPVIYITTALTERAELHIKTGEATKTYYVPAGVTTTDIEFNFGPQLIELWRNGAEIGSSIGQPITSSANSDNFNVYSAYFIVAAGDSNTWVPSDAFGQSHRAQWFTTPADSRARNSTETLPNR